MGRNILCFFLLVTFHFSQAQELKLSKRQILNRFVETPDSNTQKILYGHKWLLKYVVKNKLFKKVESSKSKIEQTYKDSGILESYIDGQKSEERYRFFGEEAGLPHIIFNENGVDESTYRIVKLNDSYMIVDVYVPLSRGSKKNKKSRRLVFVSEPKV